jgi:hypothetical protein
MSFRFLVQSLTVRGNRFLMSKINIKLKINTNKKVILTLLLKI